ncbi:hypothetical protein TNCV_2911821 [Trichonephila clavipes]|nr:hypothetical protein TNCV_2911821 [Trichonephila clavipes]
MECFNIADIERSVWFPFNTCLQGIHGAWRNASPKRFEQGVFINVALESNTRAIGDVCRNFEPMSNDEDDT